MSQRNGGTGAIGVSELQKHNSREEIAEARSQNEK